MSKALGISGFAFHNAAETERLTKPDCSKFHTMELHFPSLTHQLGHSVRPGHCFGAVRRVRVKDIKTFRQKTTAGCLPGSYPGNNQRTLQQKCVCLSQPLAGRITQSSLVYTVTPTPTEQPHQPPCTHKPQIPLTIWRLIPFNTAILPAHTAAELRDNPLPSDDRFWFSADLCEVSTSSAVESQNFKKQKQATSWTNARRFTSDWHVTGWADACSTYCISMVQLWCHKNGPLFVLHHTMHHIMYKSSTYWKKVMHWN